LDEETPLPDGLTLGKTPYAKFKQERADQNGQSATAGRLAARP
jgi:hypothetical protein